MAQAFSDLHRLYLAKKGVILIDNDGFSQRVKRYGVETKLNVAAAYVDARDKLDRLLTSIDQRLDQRLRRWMALCQEGGIGTSGIGRISPLVRTLDLIDTIVLYALCQKDTHHQSLNSYVNYLFVYTGTIVSPFVVSR